MAPYLGDWLWQSAGGGPPESAGYAVVAQGGFSNPYSYDLVSHVVAPESSFFKVPAGGSCSSNGTTAFFDLAATGPIGNQVWNFGPRSLSPGPELGVTHSLTTNAGNDTVSLLVMFANAPTWTYAAILSYDYGSNVSTPLASAASASSHNFHGISSPTKGYFYALSVDLTSHTVTAPDGPAQPTTFVNNGNAPMGGSASTQHKAIIQYAETTSSTFFSSSLYDFTSSMQSAGPNFSHSFTPVSSTVALNSAGVSSDTQAVFFEKNSSNAGGGLDSATEIYDFASGVVSSSNAIPNHAVSVSGYFYAGNSNPGSF